MRCCVARRGVASIAGRGRFTKPKTKRRGAGHDDASDVQEDVRGDAEGRLADHLPSVPVHGGELCRQDRGRARRRADQEGNGPHPGAVRRSRLVILPAVLDLGHRRRLHRQSRRHPLGAADPGGDLVAGAISDGRHRQFHDAGDLPHHPRRGRGAGLLGRRARDLQMVSGREAHAADRDPVAGLRVRRDPRRARAELDHRQSQLAPRLRRARHRRPDLGRRLVRARQGRAAGVDVCRDGRRAADSLFEAFDLAHLHRLRGGKPSAPIGRCRSG
ncbi:hypothetical protein ABIF27_002515 [Bradyrhizobium elkanii]